MNSGSTVSLTLSELLTALVVVVTWAGSLLISVLAGYRALEKIKVELKESITTLDKNLTEKLVKQDKDIALVQQALAANAVSADNTTQQVKNELAMLHRDVSSLSDKQSEDRVKLTRVAERVSRLDHADAA